MMDTRDQPEEPETSWSENTTPASDDLGDIDDDVEEIIRFPVPLRRSGEFGQGPRLMRGPIRRRTRTDLYHDLSVTKCQQSYTFPMLDSRHSMDGSEASTSSAITIITSPTSSSSDPWSASRLAEDDEDLSDREDEDMLLVPKLEPQEEEINMADVKETTTQTESHALIATPITTKRPRGRPRKHPKVNLEDKAKVAKARSKTGCITCRKRKKKCDERKPGCLNCEKNAAICEGYPPKTVWKSGKEKAEEGMRIINYVVVHESEVDAIPAAQLRRMSFSVPSLPPRLPPIIDGVETPGDRIFFHHYLFNLGYRFTVEGEHENAFTQLLLSMAVEHPQVMHSILGLSGKHIDFSSPYGLQLLKEHPEVDLPTLEARSEHHALLAMKELAHNTDQVLEQQGQTTDLKELIDATMGQMLCHVLETLADPSPRGFHRVSLKKYHEIMSKHPPTNSKFSLFANEFFQYHTCADELIFFPTSPADEYASNKWEIPSTIIQPAAVRLLGVFDNLFTYMSRITQLRNQIRNNLERGVDPPVPYQSRWIATEIEAGLRDWEPAWPTGDARDLAGHLYRQMLYVYLYRTIYPPSPPKWKVQDKLIGVVNDGIDLLSRLGPRDSTQTLALVPAFVLGCAAFEESQREPIRKAIGAVKAYMEYKNSDTALLVLEKVWRLMDAKDPRSWDWQRIAHDMGLDFLAT
ncbi:fungal-specific transcription factor domain-containing protein [Bisporella sp. PMI_857]|nr:fungal-specific transcription factor domain-containing protein [Bisporella sp. PMI_857]